MDCIETLDELIELLKQSDPSSYNKVARNIQIPASEFESFSFWKEEGYSRNCIERTAVFELILICWNPGAKTPVHAHDEQRCWVYQIDGKVEEVRYKQEDDGVLIPCYQAELTPGRLSYMHDEMGYHTLCNNTKTNAMSLHLYVSPIDACQVFDTATAAFRQNELNYHSFKGTLAQTKEVS